jgi:ferric-dicitrate binding protein FerR (iron transport regulator)
VADAPWDRLIEAHLDGTISASESEDLSLRIEASPQLGRLLLELAYQEAVLQSLVEEAQGGVITEPPSVRPATPDRRNWSRMASVVVACSLLVAGSLVWLLRIPSSMPTISPASLVAANDAVWADPNVEVALRAGEVGNGMVRLESGSAELLLADGASLVLRGPVAFRFLARKRLLLEEGRLTCRCPSPQSRISVVTAATEVIDLGTEFFVEARPDRSTRVAVLRGEVQVGNSTRKVLKTGEAVEVRSDGIREIRPLQGDEFGGWLVAPQPPHAEAHANLLRDPGFEMALADSTWRGTEGNLAVSPQGRTDRALRILARGPAQWPQCRQRIETGDISGKVAVASVYAAGAPDEPPQSGQVAILKLAFVNGKGREFAFAMRRAPLRDVPPGEFVRVEMAAVAPPGTTSLQFQVMLQTHRRGSGSVLFDDASLSIMEP